MIGKAHFRKICFQQCSAFSRNACDKDADLAIVEQRLADALYLFVGLRSTIDHFSSALAHLTMVVDLGVAQIGEGLFAQRKQCSIDRSIPRCKLFEHTADIFCSHDSLSFHLLHSMIIVRSIRGVLHPAFLRFSRLPC